MGVKADYPQLNIIDFETRHSTNALEVIFNVIVSMGTFLEWLLTKRDVQGSFPEDSVIFTPLIWILIKN